MKKLILTALLLCLGITSKGAATFAIDQAGKLLAPTSVRVPNKATLDGPIQYTWTTISASDIDWNAGNSRFKSLTANTTFTFSNLADDRDIAVAVQQDATGGRTITWPNSIVWVTSTNQVNTPAVNSTANFHSLYHFWRRSGVVYGTGPTTSPSVFSVNFDAGNASVADLSAKLSDGAALTKLSGNVIRLKGYIVLTHPHNVDGVGTVLQTNDVTLPYFGQGLFANATAASGNFLEYRITVPEDIDTSVDLKVERFKFRLGGADTATHRYVITMASVADSAAYVGASLINTVNLDFAGDASGASGDVETINNVTLTSWKGSLTAGQLWVIRVARDGNNAADASTVSSYSGPLVISYGIVQ